VKGSKLFSAEKPLEKAFKQPNPRFFLCFFVKPFCSSTYASGALGASVGL
jgi:hypothetical protein